MIYRITVWKGHAAEKVWETKNECSLTDWINSVFSTSPKIRAILFENLFLKCQYSEFFPPYGQIELKITSDN